MKRLGIIGVALLALTGCAQQHAPISDAVFVDKVGGLSTFANLDPATIAELGQDYCDYLTEYGKGTEHGRRLAAAAYLNTIAEHADSTQFLETALFLGYSVGRFCPAYRTN